jgi:transposase
MFYVKKLTTEEIITLEAMHKNHPRHLTRKRAHTILLSHYGFSIPEICTIYKDCRQTISRLFKKWEAYGLCGLVDKPGRGRHPILTRQEELETLKKVEKSPRKLKNVIAEIENEFKKTMCLDTLKRLCKKAGLVWKRVRKSLRSKRDQAQFDVATEEINQLIQHYKKGEIDLLYADESGFSLEPCIPYAWQPINKTIEISSSKSKRLNVLGFLNRDCQFHSFVFEGSITSAVMVSCFDWLANQIKMKTVVVIDNAPIHTSHEFNSHIDKWKEKGLIIYRLPYYSPELNIIEMLWKRIKYDWLPFKAYESFACLKEALFNVLSNVGVSYKMAFT